MKFGDNLKYYRKLNNYTQTDIGERMGVTKTGVSYWESNKAQPSLDIIEELAKLFNINVSTLLGESKTEYENNVDYPELFLPEHAPLAHRYVLEKRPMGMGGIDLNNISNEQAIAFANLIRQSEKRVDEDAELFIFRAAMQKRYEEGE